jgi:hypothetical protein
MSGDRPDRDATTDANTLSDLPPRPVEGEAVRGGAPAAGSGNASTLLGNAGEMLNTLGKMVGTAGQP